jgi:TetR/AcrR family transcriptional regulator, cholesterol catabolism regulator
MKKKGEKTRSGLLRTAVELFSEKGYASVSMQDFCERHAISRGGLYRHFASTKEIFLAMLDSDRENASDALDKAIASGISAKPMIDRFLNTQKLELQQGHGRLSVAIYEFCTTEPDQKDYLERRFTSAVETLAKLIQYGQARQEFCNCDPQETARHIIIFIEGLRLSTTVISFSEPMLESQLRIISQMVVGIDEPEDNTFTQTKERLP